MANLARKLLEDSFMTPEDLTQFLFSKPIERVDPITVWIHYCPLLQEITGQAKEWAIVNNGAPFMFLFESILRSYPQIEREYPPEAGRLGFTLNFQAPSLDALLRAGDQIHFGIFPPACPGSARNRAH